MSLETLISQYGYPALVLGLFLEGETVLVLAAFMAHRGYFNLPLVILIGFLVAFSSDQFFFWIGRTQGQQFLEKRPAWQPHVEKAKSLLGRNINFLFLSIRFMYGLRTVLPFVIGTSKFDPKKFALFDFVSSLIWALTFGLAGHFIGHLTTLIFEDVKEHELTITIVILIVGLGIWFFRRYSDKKRPN
ncbi:MAG: DedA family protein [Anaerolineales bacterium]